MCAWRLEAGREEREQETDRRGGGCSALCTLLWALAWVHTGTDGATGAKTGRKTATLTGKRRLGTAPGWLEAAAILSGMPRRLLLSLSSSPFSTGGRSLGLTLTTPLKGGHSGYPKNSGRVIRVVGNSGIKNCYPIFAPKKYYPKFRVPDNSGSGSGFTRYTRN
jgi:hypothetical protein